MNNFLEQHLNQVLRMDALELLKVLPGNSIDAVITDPPYNVTRLDFEQAIDWPTFWCECRRVAKDKRTPFILFSQQPFTTDLINSNRDGFRYELIWEKTMPVGFLDANRRPLRAHENILVFGDALPAYYPVMEESAVIRASTHKRKSADHYNKAGVSSYKDSGSRYPRSVFKFAQRNTAFQKTKVLHPTQKPEALMERLILLFTQADDLILDLFAGSGTTGAAARNTGRNYVLCENNPQYYATAVKRLQQQYTVPMFESALLNPQREENT